MRNELGMPPALSYGAAAALAVTIDFPLDATVKQSMAAPPHERPSGGPIASMIGLLRKRRFLVFAGLSAKAIEFAVSYAVTGACSGYAVRLLG